MVNPTEIISIHYIKIELEFGSVTIFFGMKKTREPGEKPLEQGENLTHL